MYGWYKVARMYKCNEDDWYMGFDGLACTNVFEALERAKEIRSYGVQVCGIWHETREHLRQVVSFDYEEAKSENLRWWVNTFENVESRGMRAYFKHLADAYAYARAYVLRASEVSASAEVFELHWYDPSICWSKVLTCFMDSCVDSFFEYAYSCKL